MVDADMRMAVARDLVAGIDDTADQLRVALGNPTEGEERRARPAIGKNLEYAIGVALDPARQAVPVRAADGGGERADLEIILDVDGHRVAPGVYPCGVQLVGGAAFLGNREVRHFIACP